jgi:hypothetical protein
MSALPYLLMAIMLQFAGHLADWLRSTGPLTTTQVYVTCLQPSLKKKYYKFFRPTTFVNFIKFK